VAVCSALACIAGASLAAPLAPGSTVVGPPGTTLAAEPWLAGTLVEDVVTPFSYEGWLTDASGEPVTDTGLVTGSVQSRVVRSVDGTFDFHWRISVDANAFLPVLDFTLTGLAPATYNANWLADGPGTVVPAFIAQHPAGTVDVAFGAFIEPSTQVHPGEHSRFVFLDTDARGYSAGAFYALASGRDSGGSMMIQWGGGSGPYATFMPTTPVPEPAAAWLMLCGLGVLGVAVRARRR
jgi:hypothetical protein